MNRFHIPAALDLNKVDLGMRFGTLLQLNTM